jgi:hypothetical protein
MLPIEDPPGGVTAQPTDRLSEYTCEGESFTACAGAIRVPDDSLPRAYCDIMMLVGLRPSPVDRHVHHSQIPSPERSAYVLEERACPVVPAYLATASVSPCPAASSLAPGASNCNRWEVGPTCGVEVLREADWW